MDQPTEAFAPSPLFRAFQRKDDKAVKFFFYFHKDRLYRQCAIILGSNEGVEDIVLDAFMVTFENRLQIRDEDALAGYWYRTAWNKCQQQIRSKRQQQVAEGVWADQQESDAEEDVRDAELARLERLFGDIARMPPQRRRILLMRFYFGKSVKTIANILSLSDQTVRNSINDGRKSLNGKRKPSKK